MEITSDAYLLDPRYMYFSLGLDAPGLCSDPLLLAHTCLGRSTELARTGKQGIFSGISGW